MKTLLGAVSILTAIGLGQTALAANQGNPVNVEVWAQIDTTLEITVVSSTAYDFGTVPGSFDGVSSASFDIQNTGSGSTQTYSLSGTNTADWALGSSPGLDAFVLSAQFNSSAPALNSFGVAHVLTPTPVVSGPTLGGQFAGDQDGVSTVTSEKINMWVRLQAPTSSSSAGRQRVQINIDAAAL